MNILQIEKDTKLTNIKLSKWKKINIYYRNILVFSWCHKKVQSYN